MASKTVVELVDDLDGGRADETVAFALDGTEYEIDLSARNAANLRAALATFVGCAKKYAAEPRAIADTKSTPETTATVPPEREAHRPRPARRTPEPRPAPVHNREATKAAAQSLAVEPKPQPAQPAKPATKPEPAKPEPAKAERVKPESAKPKPEPARPEPKKAEPKLADPAPKTPKAPEPKAPESDPKPEPKKPSGPAAALFVPFSEAQN